MNRCLARAISTEQIIHQPRYAEGWNACPIPTRLISDFISHPTVGILKKHKKIFWIDKMSHSGTLIIRYAVDRLCRIAGLFLLP